MAAGFEGFCDALIPGTRTWCCSTSYELASKEFLWVLEFAGRFKYNGKRLIDLPGVKISTPSRGRMMLTLPWGSVVVTKSTEQPDDLLGDEIDLCILGEASKIPRAPYERMLRARLGPRKGVVLAISTPCQDGGLFMEFFENGKSTELDYADWASWQFATIDNPTFDKEEFEKARRELPRKVFEEQYLGMFVSMRGLCFPDYTGYNLIKDSELSPEWTDWPILLGIHQNGYNNPFVVSHVAICPQTNEYLVFDEMHTTQTTPQEMIPKIKEKIKFLSSQGRKVRGVIASDYDKVLHDEMEKERLLYTTNNEAGFNKRTSTLRKVQLMQSLMTPQSDLTLPYGQGFTPVKILESRCPKISQDFQKLKWPDPKKEEADQAEEILPLPKYLPGVLACSYPICFNEEALGFDHSKREYRHRKAKRGAA
ncbi:MAG: hypothetical protein KDD59_14380 [Bdellovibrionales bacterium]|nr:hypothetical protein [Bdellovibrionales bacterium]